MATKDTTLLARQLKRWRIAFAVLAVLFIGLLALYIQQALLFTIVEENRARNPNIAESTGGPEDFDAEQFLQDNPAPSTPTVSTESTEALVDDVQAEFSTDIKNLLESVQELENLKQQLDVVIPADATPTAE